MSVIASFEWSFIWDNRDQFLHGLWVTLKVSVISIAGAFVVGLVLGAARAHRIPVVSQLAAVYVEVIRNTPLLVQVFFVYFGLSEPPFNIRLTAFTAGCVTLIVWGGAFNTENFRAGFEAVPARYREAGLALGLSRPKTFVNVTLPSGGWRCPRRSAFGGDVSSGCGRPCDNSRQPVPRLGGTGLPLHPRDRASLHAQDRRRRGGRQCGRRDPLWDIADDPLLAAART